MDTQKLIARLRERAATQDACGCWSLDKVVADELERLRKVELVARMLAQELSCGYSNGSTEKALERALDGLS